MYQRTLINENKWRASRYGIEGKLIDFGKEQELPTKSLILELLDFVDDVLDELDSRKSVEYVLKMLENGTGADRQLAIYKQRNDFKDVVDYIQSEFIKAD